MYRTQQVLLVLLGVIFFSTPLLNNACAELSEFSMEIVIDPGEKNIQLINDPNTGTTRIRIEPSSQQIWLTVQLIGTSVESSAKSTMKFSLTRPQTQEPIMTGPPTLSFQIDQLLKKADTYFRDQRFIPPQKDKNAFDLYKAVLKQDPANHHARARIREITTMCKIWADGDYRKGDYKKAKRYYQKYLVVARYILYDLEDESIRQEYQEVEERLKR